jgi:light-regulated signal transduction histidine kinase (bacteriophytochrome)
MSTGKKTFNEPDYYQPAVVYNATIRVGFHKERIAYPFYSPSVFYTEEDATKIFGRFFRSSDVQQEDGVGIGLYLTREILSKEDGYIKVISKNK